MHEKINEQQASHHQVIMMVTETRQMMTVLSEARETRSLTGMSSPGDNDGDRDKTNDDSAK